MPLYMLDTNICIYLLKKQPAAVVQRFAQYYVGEVVMSAITLAELHYGATISSNPSHDRQRLDALIVKIKVAVFDASAAAAYTPIRLATRDRKRDQLDKLIAAHAVSLGITLVTNDEKDFAAYPGLRIENWVKR